MNIHSTVNTLFKPLDGHTLKAVVTAATTQDMFERIWEGHNLEAVTHDMDSNAASKGLTFSPVMAAVFQSDKDGHLHAMIGLPLQKWTAGLNVEDSIEESKLVQREVDWIAGFMEPFVKSGSIAALDLQTNVPLVGRMENLEKVMEGGRPVKDKSELLSDAMDIGSADEILGQLSEKQIEHYEEKTELPPLPILPVEEEREVKDPKDEMRAQQTEVAEKYGFPALMDLLSRTKQPLLIEEPK